AGALAAGPAFPAAVGTGCGGVSGAWRVTPPMATTGASNPNSTMAASRPPVSLGLDTEGLLGGVPTRRTGEGTADLVDRSHDQVFEVGADQVARQRGRDVLLRREAGDRLRHAFRIHRELEAHRP